MSKPITISLLAAVLLLMTASILSASGKDLSAEYCQMLATYHEEPFDKVMALVSTDLSAEDVAVVFHISERLHVDPQKVVDQHGESGSWMATATKLGLSAVDFHVPGVDASASKTFAPIYKKFRSTAASKWREIELDDSEIMNLVNMSLLLNYHPYDIDKIMALRDKEMSFAEINVDMSKKEKEAAEGATKE